MEPLPDRLPLVIGVTGHRDLRDQDVPDLERQVAAIINELRHDYLGRDGETPIIILSSLAEGADRLVARVALAQGARLVAPMPLPIEEYRRDFEPGLKAGNMAEFDALLEQAVAAPIMPFVPGSSLEAVRSDRAKRNEQYRAVGLYITQHCNVLVTLWDGNDRNAAAGGTAEVVAFKRRGVPMAVSESARVSLDASEVGPVIHVVTPRQKKPQDGTKPPDAVAVAPWGRALVKHARGGVVRRFAGAMMEFAASLFGRELADPRSHLSDALRRELESWETFEALVSLTRHFNREAAALAKSADGAAAMAKSQDGLLAATDIVPSVGPEAAREHAHEKAARWCRMYSIADTLAQRRQQQFRRDWLQVYVLAFVAFLCFALFEGVSGAIPFEWASDAILVCYSLAFVAIFLVFGRALLGNHQVHFLDYRAFAEALRVLVFWRIVGVGARYRDAKVVAGETGVEVGALGAVADSYPIKQPNELAWVKIGLRMLELVEAAEPASVANGLDPTSHAIARYFWVEGQGAFYGRGESRHDRLAQTLENSGLLLLVVSPFLIVPLVIAAGHDAPLRHTMLLLSGLLPGLATVLNGYSDKLALKPQARQYDRMRVLFSRALELLPETIDAQSAPLARMLYAELGAESLQEQAEWVAIYRQRPIEPPR
jgi:hypothetical protein